MGTSVATCLRSLLHLITCWMICINARENPLISRPFASLNDTFNGSHPSRKLLEFDSSWAEPSNNIRSSRKLLDFGAWTLNSRTLNQADGQIAVGVWQQTIYLIGGNSYPYQVSTYHYPTQKVIDMGVSFLSYPIRNLGQYYTQPAASSILYMINPDGYTFSYFDLSSFLSSQILTYPWSGPVIADYISGGQGIGSCLVAFENNLYILGGKSDPYGLKNVYKLDILTEKVQPIGIGMLYNRQYLSCAVHEGSRELYAIGGSAITTKIESVKIDNIDSTPWTQFVDLIAFTWYSRAIVYDEYILVVGGQQGSSGQIMVSFQIISTTTGKVTAGPGLNYAIRDTAAVVTDEDILYAFGGASQDVNAWVSSIQQIDLNIPTSAPLAIGQTANPVTSPTAPPTSVGQTKNPATSPTAAPQSVGQTANPVTSPTAAPTSIGQTSDPVTSPTASPTTKAPTLLAVIPTKTPTKRPTLLAVIPTPKPTAVYNLNEGYTIKIRSYTGAYLTDFGGSVATFPNFVGSEALWVVYDSSSNSNHMQFKNVASGDFLKSNGANCITGSISGSGDAASWDLAWVDGQSFITMKNQKHNECCKSSTSIFTPIDTSIVSGGCGTNSAKYKINIQSTAAKSIAKNINDITSDTASEPISISISILLIFAICIIINICFCTYKIATICNSKHKQYEKVLSTEIDESSVHSVDEQSQFLEYN